MATNWLMQPKNLNQNNYKLKNLRKYLLKSHANYISDNISTFRNIDKYVISKKEKNKDNKTTLKVHLHGLKSVLILK